MNHCDTYDNILQEVLDESASDGDREAFTRHLSQCRTCRNAYKSQAFSLDLLASAPVPPQFAKQNNNAFLGARPRIVTFEDSWIVSCSRLE
jgi:anti-sigma factor RsiW